MNGARIFVLEIRLLVVEPTITRVILVPETITFWGLHLAIQDAMGWEGAYTHIFQVREGVYLGIPIHLEKFEAGWKVPISAYLSVPGHKVTYVYNYTYGWNHTVELKEIQPMVFGPTYPICQEGAGACPPDDSGGPHGYTYMRDLLSYPDDPRHDEAVKLLGYDFNPQYFDPKAVRFRDNEQELANLGIS